MSTHHICYSGSLGCSGCNPCSACLEKVGQYVLTHAMMVSGLNHYDEQARAFIQGFYEGWKRFHGGMRSDPRLQEFQVAEVRMMVRAIELLQQHEAQMQGAQPSPPPFGFAQGQPYPGAEAYPMQPPWPPQQMPPQHQMPPQMPPQQMNQGWPAPPGFASAGQLPPGYAYPPGYHPPPMMEVQPPVQQQLPLQQPPQIAPTLNGAMPAQNAPIMQAIHHEPAPRSGSPENGAPSRPSAGNGIRKTDSSSRVEMLAQEMDAEEIAASVVRVPDAAPHGRELPVVLGNVMHVPPGMEDHLREPGPIGEAGARPVPNGEAGGRFEEGK